MSDFYLMQRLCDPPKRTGGPLDKAHRVFGGGMLGLSEGGWNALDQVCKIDYMGAAEYEFGELPKFLRSWVERADSLVPFAFVLKPGEYAANWERGYRSRKNQKPLPKLQQRIIYGIKPSDNFHTVEELEAGFREVVAPGSRVYVKSGTRAEGALDPITERDVERGTRGWICLNADCCLFVNETMWRGFGALFGQDFSDFDVPEVELDRDYALMKKPELVAQAVALGVCRTKTEANKMKMAELVARLEGRGA
jgi:hypothetical protein